MYSDGYLGMGAALLIESWRIYLDPTDEEYDHRPHLIYAPIFGTEWGVIYATRKTGYGSYYTETSPWVEVPIVEKVYFGRFSLGAGIFLAKAAGKVTRQFSSQTNLYNYSDINRRPFDIGGTLAIGYFFWDSPKLFFDLRHNPGLINLSKASGSEYKNTDYRLLMGIRF
jgi:hypothetical protein